MLKKLSPKNDLNTEQSVTVRFLDESEPLQIKYQKHVVGQWLLDEVCKELNLVERDYFGLRYVDSDKQRHWIDPLKLLHRQLKGVSPAVVCFRAKFYPADPTKLQEEVTKYFLFLQLRRDLHHGRLLCSGGDANVMAAYIIQSEVGDYHPDDCSDGYVSEFKMLPRQTHTEEEKIMEIHKTLVGQVPSEAEESFLKKAVSLDTYGVDPHAVKDQSSTSLYLGITHMGVVTFHSNKRTHLYKWEKISKIAFEGKMFIVHSAGSEPQKKLVVGYKCPTYAACKHLWKCALEQQSFFTLNKAIDAKKFSSGGGLFHRSSKFRFSGRCQNEVYSHSASVKRESVDFARSPSSTLQRRFSQKRSPRKIEDLCVPVMQSLNVSVDSTVDDSGTEQIEGNELTTESGITLEVPETFSKEHSAEDHLDNQMNMSDKESQDTLDGDSLPNHVNERSAIGDIGIDTPPNTPTMLQDDSPQNGFEVTSSGDYLSKTTPPASDGTAKPGTEEKQKKGTSCCKVFTISLFFSFLLLAIAFILVMEEGVIQHSLLDDIRKSDTVQNLQLQYYSPAKEFVTEKVNSVLKK